MEPKDKMDSFGTVVLIIFALLLAINQVAIKVVNDGVQPVFFAGFRSFAAIFLVWGWVRLSGRRFNFIGATTGPAIALGLMFSLEFLLMFLALDHTTVTRMSVIFYSMPVWLALAAHFFLPGERIGRAKAVGLALAFGGVAWAIIDRGDTGADQGISLLGDLLALGTAFSWAGIALIAKGTSASRLNPQTQMIWQLGISAPVLLIASTMFGPILREFEPVHLLAAGFQIVVIGAAGFLFWMWMLTIYPASSVASFSFLSPIFGIFLGWVLLGEHVGWALLGSGVLVALGLVLINWPARKARILKPG